jgi:hypothetical protein
MARAAAGLPAGSRVTDFISIGVLAARYPRDLVDRVLAETGRGSQRQRQLPAHVVVYYVIALALFMSVSYGEVLQCLLEGLSWLGLPPDRVRTTGRSGISQARARLGPEPMRRIFETVAKPIATKKTRGAFYREWRVVAIDGTTLDVPDTTENEREFGRPGVARGKSGFPQLRAVFLIEVGTHAFFHVEAGPYTTSENVLAAKVVERLSPGMLCLADRGYFSYGFWKSTRGRGADLLWRVRADAILPCLERLDDGSFLSKLYPSVSARRRDDGGVAVRVVEYTLDGAGAEPQTIYRLVTTILDPLAAPAKDLADLYHQRWEIETAFDELKTHLRGRQVVLRSKTPDLLLQEFYGLLLAHYAVRGLMHEAALTADVDPDRLSFVHAIRVVRRDVLAPGSFPPSASKA